MKHKINVIGTFILVLLCSSLYIISEKKVISESEKRVLTTLPRISWRTYLNADFMREHEKHINDHFPFRKTLILFAGKIRQNMGVQRKNSAKIVFVDAGRKIPRMWLTVLSAKITSTISRRHIPGEC